jgi:hypothetical protein
MLVLNLKIVLSHSNPEYDRGDPNKNVMVTLATVPPITYAPGKDKPAFGLWTCSSVYFGKETFGTYYVTRLPGLEMENPATKQAWERREREGWVRDRRVVNPVGLFFDSASGPESDGFATFYSFAPREDPRDRGFGLFNRTEDINIKLSGFDWSRSG